MLLQLVHEDLHFFPHLRRGWPSLAGRIAVPFHIDDGRKRIGFLGNIADEPICLLACHTAPIEEMVSTAFDASGFRFAPVLAEHWVEVVPAVSSLDISEICALRAQFHPIDIALPEIGRASCRERR